MKAPVRYIHRTCKQPNGRYRYTIYAIIEHLKPIEDATDFNNQSQAYLAGKCRVDSLKEAS